LIASQIASWPKSQIISIAKIGRKRGQFAEFKVRWFLWLKGYQLIAKRWRCTAGKIDLILQYRNRLILRSQISPTWHDRSDFIATLATAHHQSGVIIPCQESDIHNF
jgi:hypothetical protein